MGLISKPKGKAVPFVAVGKNSQKFYEELANIPSASNGKKTDPTPANELYRSLRAGK